jgi:Na+-translocating ferredoxin:NAD+ oxidoreductase RnfD subunit
MVNQSILLGHVASGVACLLAALWVFVETLNASEANRGRTIKVSWVGAVVMWLSFLMGGYWYVVFYKHDRVIILDGPWPSAHNVVMETKEHLVITLLLLATYLAIVVSTNNVAVNRTARRLTLVVSGLVALLALLMEAEGGLIAMGLKMSLLAK